MGSLRHYMIQVAEKYFINLSSSVYCAWLLHTYNLSKVNISRERIERLENISGVVKAAG